MKNWLYFWWNLMNVTIVLLMVTVHLRHVKKLE